MMTRKLTRIGLLHYSAPPVIGGVENVILTHARLLIEAGYPVTVLAGRGKKDALPPQTKWIQIPELDTQHPQIGDISEQLEKGYVPKQFEEIVSRLTDQLGTALTSIDILIAHNVFTKHFNLPLTAALVRLLEQGAIRRCIAWCHDITWTSPNSREKVFPGYPWNLLRTECSDLTYVTVSKERQGELADLFRCAPEEIRVIYNGVDPDELLGLSNAGLSLINRIDLWGSDLNLLMPVRVTRAKNIELALRVVAALKERGIRPKLVVTGPPDPHDNKSMEYFESLLALRERLEIKDQMHFVYESGPISTEPFMIQMPVVAELLRVSDALLMPSHREGFGMPVLEAGLVGIPVFCTDRIPAANEIGGRDMIRFSPEASPNRVAQLILHSYEQNPVLRLRRQIRQNLSWHNIFRQKIVPLLNGGLS